MCEAIDFKKKKLSYNLVVTLGDLILNIRFLHWKH